MSGEEAMAVVVATDPDLEQEVSQDSGLESPTSKDDTPEKRPDSFMAESVPLLIATEKHKEKDVESSSDNIVIGDAPIFPFSINTEKYDDEPDETLAERLWGLTEMFPDCIVNATHKVTTKTWLGIKYVYSFSRTALWITASTSVILFAPVFFELEIAKIEEKQKSEQKQYLLGPSAAMINPNAPPPMPR